MRKKILLVLPLPPPMHGSNYMNELVARSEFLSKNYNVNIFPLRYASSIADIGSINLRKFIRLASYLYRMRNLIHSFKPDLIYFVPALTGLSFLRDCLFVLVFRQSCSATIFHLHGHGIRKACNSRFNHTIYKWFFKNAFIIMLSPALKRDLDQIDTFKEIFFLPNGITDSFGEKIAKSSGQRGQLKLLFLSNLIESKGLIVLLKACKILKERSLSFSLQIAGNPSKSITKARLKMLVTNFGLDEYIVYLGPKYGQEKNRLLMESDILVFPTLRDAFPLVVLEAMSAGLPVVSTREGAIPEIVDDGVTGFIVKKGDEKELASKLEELISHPELIDSMGKAGRKKYEKKYTLDCFYKNLDNIIKSIISYGK